MLFTGAFSHVSSVCGQVKVHVQGTRGAFPDLIATSLPPHRSKVDRNLKAAATLFTVIGLETLSPSETEDEVAMGTAAAAAIRAVLCR